MEKLAAQTRLAKASLRAGTRPYPVQQQQQQQGMKRGNKENVIDDAGLAYSSPSRRSGGGFGFLDANAYRYAGAQLVNLKVPRRATSTDSLSLSLSLSLS